MISVRQFRDLVIRPTLEMLGGPQNSEAAVRLLLATAIHESRLTYLAQISGPALGVYQMEPATHDDIWTYLNRPRTGESSPWLLSRVLAVVASTSDASRMVHDLRYATVMARIHYWRVPEPLPDAEDASGMAVYWKRYYNTELGAGTENQFLSAYYRFMPTATA